MAKKYTKFRHKVSFKIIKPITYFVAKKLNFKYSPVRLKKNENFLILANHQTFYDPALLAHQFSAPLYMVATDTLFTTSLLSKLFRFLFAPIKKRKASVDIGCIKTCVNIAKEGGNVLLFPEGNRCWTGETMFIDPSVCKLVRLLRLPLMLYVFKGGFGVNPRWGKKLRKGIFTGEVIRVLSVEEISNTSDDELYSIITKTLNVCDCDLELNYKSSRPAEYLERMFFVCPNCGSMNTLRSNANLLQCDKCRFSFTLKRNLTLTSSSDKIKFNSLKDFYTYQQNFVSSFVPSKDKLMFYDKGVKLEDKTLLKRKKLGSGNIYMTDKMLKVCNQQFFIKDILSTSVVGGTKLIINTLDKSYIVKGNKRFNALKYVFFISKLANIKDNSYGLHV